jgi:hypothetical protein
MLGSAHRVRGSPGLPKGKSYDFYFVVIHH